MTELERCPRCNRTEFVHKRRSAECTWCWARLTKRSRDSYHFEPFLWYRPHTPAAAQMHTQAAAQQPHPTTARWEPVQRQIVLRYIAWRDDSRCGLCGMPLPIGEGHIEHIVPKMFGFFDFDGERVEPGTTYMSRLHHVDNLQAAHPYCNQPKGNSRYVTKWRHPMMWSLPVARKQSAHQCLWVPGRR